MGQKNSKKPFQPRQIQKTQFELCLKKISLKVKLVMDRRTGQLRRKEKALLQLLNKKARNQQDEYIKGSSIVSDQSYVDACNIVLRYCDIMNDKSMNIVQSGGDAAKVQEVVPYMLSVLWARNQLNEPSIGELHRMMAGFYGPGIDKCLQQGDQVDAELQALFKNLMPTPQQVNTYFRQFCDKYDIDVVKFNSVGHQAPVGDCNPHHNGQQFQPGFHQQGPMNGGFGGGMPQQQQQMQPQPNYFQDPNQLNMLGGGGNQMMMPGPQQGMQNGFNQGPPIPQNVQTMPQNGMGGGYPQMGLGGGFGGGQPQNGHQMPMPMGGNGQNMNAPSDGNPLPMPGGPGLEQAKPQDTEMMFPPPSNFQNGNANGPGPNQAQINNQMNQAPAYFGNDGNQGNAQKPGDDYEDLDNLLNNLKKFD